MDFANATFADKKQVAMHVVELYLQDLQKEMLALRSPAIVWGNGFLADTVGLVAVAVEAAVKVGA